VVIHTHGEALLVDFEAFRRSPIGRLQSIRGYDHYLNRPYDHHTYIPADLPASVPLSEQTYKMISEADRAVGRLDAAAARLPNPSLLVRPALYREALATSALEGTYAPLVEVLEADFVDEKRRSHEVREILNWVRAAELGLELIQHKPICSTVLHQLHAVLVQGTRGDGPDRGRLRSGQVYIGERHHGIEHSRFVPPPQGHTLIAGFDAWEKWINAEDFIPLLVKCALGHYQFETLHPYHDGNGRLGRLIIVLQLIYAGALTYPILNLSPWLEPRKDQYKDLLLAVSRTGELDPWVQFFATGMAWSCDDAVRRIEELIRIREQMIDTLRTDGAKGVVLDIVDDLLEYPVITITEAASKHHVTYPPANSAIQRMVRLGILTEITGRSYGRAYGCQAVMRAIETPRLDL
jgi:Fic family protein